MGSDHSNQNIISYLGPIFTVFSGLFKRFYGQKRRFYESLAPFAGLRSWGQ
jgi:hypothetical protein